MHQPSRTHTRQKIRTTLTKYKTMQQDGSFMTTHTTQTSVSYVQKQLNWPSLSVRCLQSRLVLFYKICHQNIAIPPYLQIPLRTTRHTSNINKNSYRYRQPSTSTDTYKYSYFSRQSQTGFHCHSVCLRLQRCNPSRKA